MDDMTFMILKIVVSVAAALVTAYLIPYIKARTSAETQATVADIVSVAVKAAEQTLEGGKVKKAAVMERVTKELNGLGIKIDAEQLDALVECVVYEVKKEG